jgi:feruloyl esterase
LAGNYAVFGATSTQQTTAAGRDYCMVNVTWRDPYEVGAEGGYAPGAPPEVDTFQTIRIGIALPLNSNTGDAAWGGRLIMTAGGGAQGSVPGLTGMIGMTPAAIGAGSDSGHGDANSGSGDNWGVINGVGLNYGKVLDWAGGRSNGIAVKLAKQLAFFYYGKRADRTYWNGCSGGGHMGFAQIQNYPKEYDGALIGAPAHHWQQFRLADSWDELIRKKVGQQTNALTAGQLNAANAAANLACATEDGHIINGTPIMNDPRACTWSATNHICGMPGAPDAPNCLDEIQAAGLDTIWDGPRNNNGTRIWHPYDRGINLGTGTNTQGSTVQVMRYNHADTSFAGSNLYADRESIRLARRAGMDVTNAITYEEEAVLTSNTTSDYIDDDDPTALDEAYKRGIKIIVYHGTQDPAIHFRNDVDYYRLVATHRNKNDKANFKQLQDWYRLFLVPGAGHCPAVPQALPKLIDWVENGVAPDYLDQTTLVPRLCPFPQKARYEGGPVTEAASYSCGGNLDNNEVAMCSMLRTKYKKEDKKGSNWKEAGIAQDACGDQSEE